MTRQELANFLNEYKSEMIPTEKEGIWEASAYIIEKGEIDVPDVLKGEIEKQLQAEIQDALREIEDRIVDYLFVFETSDLIKKYANALNWFQTYSTILPE